MPTDETGDSNRKKREIKKTLEGIEAYEGAYARRSAADCSVAVDLTDSEKTALDDLCAQKDMTRQGVMLAALRLYQAVALGAAEVTWKYTGPGCMGDDCSPNVSSHPVRTGGELQ